MFLLQPGLAALALIPVPFVVVVATRYGHRSRPALQEVQQRIAEVTADVEENISGVRVVKAFAAEPRQLDALPRLGRARLRPVDDRDPAARVLQPVPGVPAEPRAGRDPARRRAPGRQRDADAGRLHRVLHVPADADRADADARRRARHGAARDRVGRAAAGDPRPRAADRERRRAALPAGRGRVELRDVTFGYGDGPDALRDVSLAVEPGSTVALVGATGSGKTTLVQLLPRLYDPRSGAVLIDGADVRDVDVVALRRAIAVVDDDPFLFSDTVAGNIAYARPDASREEIERAAERAQAAGFIAELPGRLRHARRRARADAERRPAPADRDRAGVPRRPADPGPRRRDLLGRRHDRARDQGRAARGDARAHDVRDRPPALDDRAGRRHRRARARPRARARHARRVADASRRCTPRSPPRACRTRCSSTGIPLSGWRGCERAPRRPRPPLARDLRAAAASCAG